MQFVTFRDRYITYTIDQTTSAWHSHTFPSGHASAHHVKLAVLIMVRLRARGANNPENNMVSSIFVGNCLLVSIAVMR